MPSVIGADELEATFSAFARSAWRWEPQAAYHEPDEAEAWQRWREGGADDLVWLQPWLDTISELTSAGKRVERVRVLADPVTEYQRWQIAVTPLNLQAGEDIRLIGAVEARRLGLPEHDFWLFDDERVAVLRYGADHAGFVGAEIITDPATVAQHRKWREVAWMNATPFRDHRLDSLAERGT